MNTWIDRFVLRLLAPLCLVLIAPLAHALSMGISVNPDRVRPNEGIIVAVTVTNETGSPVNAVSLRVQMPAVGVASIGQQYASGNATCPGTGCDPGEFVDWNLGTLAAGQGVRVTLPTAISNGTAGGTAITFPARLLVNGVQILTVSQTVTVDADNALSLNVDADKDGAAPGATLTYNLTYGNRSGVSVTGTTLVLPLPAGVTFVSATGGGSLSGNTVVWALNTLQGGQSGRQQVVVNVGAGLGSGTLLAVDAAQLAGFSSATGDELARTTLVTRVQSNPVLGLAISTNSDPARPNEAVRIEFTVSNPNSAPVFGAVLQVRMPTEGFASIGQSFFSGGATCPGTGCDPYEFATWILPTLPPGGSVTVLMVDAVTNGFASGRLIAIDAELRGDGVPMVIGRHTLAVDGDNALTLALTADKDLVRPSDSLTYTLTYGNRGPGSTTGTTLALPLPPGVAFVSASGGGVLTGSTVRWTLNTLQAGQSYRQQVVVTVASSVVAGSALPIDAALLDGTSASTGAESARAGLATRVHANPMLGLAIATNADPARPNEAVRTAFTVTNRSSDTPVFGAVLNVRVPTEGFASIGQYYQTGGAVCPGTGCDPYEFAVWNLGTIAPGGSVTVELISAVTNGFDSGRLIAIESELLADGAPVTIGRLTLAVDGDNALTLALHADKESVAPGEQLTYLLDYANRSTGTINGTVLTFPVPEGATLIASSGGTMSARRVSWSLAGVLPGTGGRRTVTIGIPANAAAGLQLPVDAATLIGNSAITGTEAARATLNTRVVAGNPLRLALVSLLANPLLPNQALTATLRVTNNGAAPLNTITLQARVPTEGVSSFGQATLSGGGVCPGTGCDPYEFAVWNIPTLAAGASTTFTMPMTVSNGFGTGRQIWLEALATDDNGDQSLASGTAMIGTQFSLPPGCATFGDFDGNGVVGFSDLALFKANFGTTNTLYDLDGNGVVNFADLAIFKTLFGNSAGASCTGNVALARQVAEPAKR